MSRNIGHAVNLRESNYRAFDPTGTVTTLGKIVNPVTGEVTKRRGIFGLTPEEAQEAVVKANTLGETKVYSKLDRGTSIGMNERRIKALAAAKAVQAAKDSGHAAGRRRRRKTRKTRRRHTRRR